MLKPSPEDLARALDDAGGVRFVRSTYLMRNRAVLTLEWQGQPVQFTFSIIEVLDGQVPDRPHSRHGDELNPGVVVHALQRRSFWTEDQLRAAGLPLYHSESWLRSAMQRLGSQAKIAEVYGYSNQAISRALIKLGIETRPRNSNEQRDDARRLRATGLSLEAVGQRVGMSKASVLRACREAI